MTTQAKVLLAGLAVGAVAVGGVAVQKMNSKPSSVPMAMQAMAPPPAGGCPHTPKLPPGAPEDSCGVVDCNSGGGCQLLLGQIPAFLVCQKFPLSAQPGTYPPGHDGLGIPNGEIFVPGDTGGPGDYDNACCAGGMVQRFFIDAGPPSNKRQWQGMCCDYNGDYPCDGGGFACTPIGQACTPGANPQSTCCSDRCDPTSHLCVNNAGHECCIPEADGGYICQGFGRTYCLSGDICDLVPSDLNYGLCINLPDGGCGLPGEPVASNIVGGLCCVPDNGIALDYNPSVPINITPGSVYLNSGECCNMPQSYAGNYHCNLQSGNLDCCYNEECMDAGNLNIGVCVFKTGTSTAYNVCYSNNPCPGQTCIQTCNPPCQENSDCPPGGVCSSDIGTSQYWDPNSATPAGCCLPADCSGYTGPLPPSCANGCVSSQDCPDFETCTNGTCVPQNTPCPGATSNGWCTNGQLCLMNVNAGSGECCYTPCGSGCCDIAGAPPPNGTNACCHGQCCGPDQDCSWNGCQPRSCSVSGCDGGGTCMTNGKCCYGAICGSDCCPQGMSCGTNGKCCPAPCGTACCDTGQTCILGLPDWCCPVGQGCIDGGNFCCSSTQHCQHGSCVNNNPPPYKDGGTMFIDPIVHRWYPNYWNH
jgi:hypothetical protein